MRARVLPAGCPERAFAFLPGTVATEPRHRLRGSTILPVETDLEAGIPLPTTMRAAVRVTRMEHACREATKHCGIAPAVAITPISNAGSGPQGAALNFGNRSPDLV